MILVRKEIPERRKWTCQRTKISVIARYEDTALRALRIKLKNQHKRLKPEQVDVTELPKEDVPPVKRRRMPDKLPKRKGKIQTVAPADKYEEAQPVPWPITEGRRTDIEKAVRSAYKGGRLNIKQLERAESYERQHANRGSVVKMIRTAVRRLKTEARMKQSKPVTIG